MPTLNAALHEYERQFQESGHIFRNTAYFAIKVVNNITKMHSHKFCVRQASVMPNTVPSNA